MIIFDRHYTDEELVDLDEHIMWTLENDLSPIPKDKYGFRQGTFRVTIEWSDEE